MLRFILQILVFIMFIGLIVLAILESNKSLFIAKHIPQRIVVQHGNYLNVEGVIASSLTMMIREGMYDTHKGALKLMEIVKSGADTVYLRINSHGGEVGAGALFTLAMQEAQQLGINLICVVEGSAYSMAAIILSECNERYAVVGSKIMWHSMIINSVSHVNVYKARSLVNFIDIYNEKIWSKTRNYFYPWYFSHHFKEETEISVSEIELTGLGYLRVIRDFKIEEKKNEKCNPISSCVSK